MAVQCPHCSEKDLPDRAQFCFNCGTGLLVEPDDEGLTVHFPQLQPDAQEETRHLRQNTPDPDDGSTRSLPETETRAVERSTRTRSDTVDLGRGKLTEAIETEGQTRDRATIPLSDSEEETRNLRQAKTLTGQASTKPPPNSAVAGDDELTRNLHRDKAVTDSGTTKAMVEVESWADDGETRQMGDAEADDAGGETRLMPGDKKTDTHLPRIRTLSDELNIGQILQERYRLDTVLGQGGFGAAYLAHDLKLDRTCVVKQMLIRGKSSREIKVYQANFEQEARLLATLNEPGHPNIPEIYDYFSDSGGNYLVMKYVEGRDLKQVVKQSENRVPWREAARYAVDVCSALDYMHTHGDQPVIHRDIKPANILLGDDGRVWLVDFGLATVGTDTARLTEATGSVGYTALEQWLGQAGSEADVYALGVTLHHLVTGVSPLEAYDGKFNIKILQDLHGQLTPIRKIDRKLPKQLEQIISQATSAEPEQRPTPHQLQQQLDVLVSKAQKAALYTFRNGKSAKTVMELVDLCEKNRQEAEGYLYDGGFERWFLLINRNDLAAAATQAVAQGKNRRDGLEKFLKLLVPNLFLRRLGRAGWRVARLAAVIVLTALAVVLLVTFVLSLGASIIAQQTITSTPWSNLFPVNPNGENVYNEEFLTNISNTLADAYFDNLSVEIRGPDTLIINGEWLSFPFELSNQVGMGQKNPRMYLTEVNGIPLLGIGPIVSQRLNDGIDDTFQESPVDVTRLLVQDHRIVFKVAPSDDLSRPLLPTPTPGPTPTLPPLPTPTLPVEALVIISNDLGEAVTVELQGQQGHSESQVVPVDAKQVIEIPPGQYVYTVTYQASGARAYTDDREWTLDTAYRLYLELPATE